jgi:hypothetical protein
MNPIVSPACLAAAGALAISLLASPGSHAADRSTARRTIQYPAFASVESPKVLAQFNGVKVYGGGFGSALAADPRAPGYFFLLTDRGPNTDNNDPDQKVFPIPGFTPQIGRFRLNGDRLELVGVIPLRDAKGRRITGLPNPSNGNTGEIAVDLNGRKLGTDRDGLDSEGLVALRDGTFWVSDEYGPWLVHFDAKGRTLDRIGPFPGKRSLPKVLALRRPNRGMESLTIMPDGQTLVGMMQNPLDNPDTHVRKTSRLNRIVVYDPRTNRSMQFGYLLDSTSAVVSDIAAVTNTRYLVLERDQLMPRDPKTPSTLKRVYEIDISGATDISDPKDDRHGMRIDGRTLEQSSEAQLRQAGIVTPAKKLVVDLLALPGGYPHDKPEGLAIIAPGLIAVSNDDDFGIVPDGKGGIAPKTLPAENDRVDLNRVYFIRLAVPLR